MVPDARVAGHGASRGALLITDQCRLRCPASNRGQSAEQIEAPWTCRGECHHAGSDILAFPFVQ